MKQSEMLFRLQLKRAAKKLPQLIAGSLAISAVVIIVVLFCAYSRNAKGVLETTRIAISAGNNDFFRELAGDILGGMESADSMLQFVTLEEEEALKRFAAGELEGVIVFPDDYLGNIGRGDDVPAKIYVKSDGVAYDLGIITRLAGSAERFLASAEATSYSMKDMLDEFGYHDISWEYDSDLDVVNMRMVLSREDNFMKITILGEDSTTMSQSYACAALVMLLLLWGLSCGAIIRNDGKVMTGKLAVGGVSVFKQELIRVLSIVFLLGTMLSLVFAVMLVSFPFAKNAFAQVGVTSMGQIAFLFVTFIPSLIFAGAAVLLVFTAAANEIGGILMLFTGTIVMGYISGCLLPSVYLPKSIRKIAKYFPTTYMHREAEAGFAGNFDLRSALILLGFALVLFALAVLVRAYKSKRE